MPASPDRLGWFARVLIALAPSLAVRRIAAAGAARELARAYEAAKVGRRTQGWITPGTSAAAEIGPAVAILRSRARDLVRNNPHAAHAVALLAAHVVGRGFSPRLLTERAAIKARVGAEWEAFSAACDPEGALPFAALQRLVMRCVIESGAAVVRLLPGDAQAAVPLQVQILEPDHIDHAKSEGLADGGEIVQGVEFDAFGRRRAYWLFDRHPGSSFGWGGKGWGDSRRVAAEHVLHIFERLRPGQVHGVPWFAPAMMAMRDLDDLAEARRVKKKIEACFTAFVRRAPGSVSPTLTDDPATDAAGRRIEALSPGMIQYLRQDEDITFGVPSSSEGDADWLILQLHAVAAGLGMPYATMTGDLRQANYSSLRAGMLDFWALVDGWQDLIEHQLCRPVWAKHDQLLRLRGQRAGRAVLPPVVWSRPERQLVDPKKDYEASLVALRAGLKTWKGAVAATGADPDQQIAELADERADLAAAGVTLDLGGVKAAAAPADADQPEPSENEDADDAKRPDAADADA